MFPREATYTGAAGDSKQIICRTDRPAGRKRQRNHTINANHHAAKPYTSITSPLIESASTKATPAPPISRRCAHELRKLIEDYGGREVFVIGSCDESGSVDQLDPIAFGTWDCVPAPAQNARPGQVLIHNHPDGPLDPSNPDIEIASLYGKSGVGFFIVNNECDQVRIVVKPFRETPVAPIDLKELLKHFGPSGKIALSMPGYERRPQQLAMMELVGAAFNTDRIAVAEAGTGIGKSFAYLAPAIAWSRSNKKRVLISTNTINLQEQLMSKDIPELQSRLGWDFRAVLVKGRSNYVSLRRLNFSARDAQLFPDAKSVELKLLQEWAGKTTDGTRSDLAFEVLPEAWEAAMSDKDDCLRAQCPNFNECFYYKSRREAASADIIVANHHLVMADVALKRDSTGNDYTAILPPFERIVFDEAHNLEDVATSYFSQETSVLAMRRQLNRLISPRENKGAAVRLHRAIFENDSRNLFAVTRQILDLLEQRVLNQRGELDFALDTLFKELFEQTLHHFHIQSLARGERRELRITRTVTESSFWAEVLRILKEITGELTRFLGPLDKALTLLRQYPDTILKELMDYRANVSSAHMKLSEHVNILKFFMKAGEEDYCRWLEVGYVRDQPMVRPCAAPLDVAPALRSALFEKKRTVILTSATLTVDKKFDYLSRQLGLGLASTTESDEPAPEPGSMRDVASRCDFLQLDTPFDYATNCIVGIPRDLPLPTDSRFDELITPSIVQTLKISQGRAFVLFTSYRSLQKVLANCQNALAAEGITCLRQGEMPRHRLLEVFKSTPRCVLFATSSFWEGVDVQGKALECLILTKLPFSVPSAPILEARTERIDRMGGSSFYELAVPMAVIRFKQGFGRLIRSKSDRGIIMVLDHRVITKHYGKVFLRSLPPARIVEGSSGEVNRAVMEFFATEAGFDQTAGPILK